MIYSPDPDFLHAFTQKMTKRNNIGFGYHLLQLLKATFERLMNPFNPIMTGPLIITPIATFFLIR